MADTITFTHVSLSNGTTTAHFSPTTITIDYSNLTVTGSVTVNVDGTPHTFNDLHLEQTGSDSFSLYAGSIKDPGLRMPTGFTAGVVFITNPTGDVFDQLTHNHIVSVCFAARTLIRTPAGDAPVETLKAGDLVLTASGAMRPVKWMGHTDVDFRRTPKGGQDFRSGSSPTRSARPGLRRTFTCPPAIRSASIFSAKS